MCFPSDKNSKKSESPVIMKKTLLIAVFLLPIAWAKVASPQILPLPECFPCADTNSITVTSTNPKILPLPECFPCADTNNLTVAVASPKILPLPECFPCADTNNVTVAATTQKILPLPECFPCADQISASFTLRRQA
jgi:hypothetical protein